MTHVSSFSAFARIIALVFAGLVVAGCAAPPPPTEVNDPLENTNRAIHSFNRGLDTVAVRPVSQIYGTIVPDPIRFGVSNFASNLGLPSSIINHTLQGAIRSAASNTGRFLMNTTIGIGGFLDPASALGVLEDETDFGETLHVWGTGEGAFVELPFFGPSTTRDAVGQVVDIVLDPVGVVVDTPVIYYAAGAQGLSGLDFRYRFTETVDSIYYDSADSYAQSRLIYLQNRRFDLGQDTGATDILLEEELYDDLYFE